MKKQYISSLRQLHKRFLELMDVPDEDLFKIPEGFNNHIFWNFAHALVTQESLIYALSGKPSHFPKEIIHAFKNGSIPSGAVEMELLKDMKQASLDILDKLEADLGKENAFSGFNSYHLGLFDYQLESIEDALMFNQIHFSLHLGYALALKRALN